MDYMNEFMNLVAQLPELVVLTVCPGLLLIGGLLLAIFGARKGYLPLAIGLGGVGFFLACCQDATAAFAYLGLYAAFAALVSLLFLIPFKGKKKNTQEELYKKFRLELEEPGEEADPREEELYDREESGLRLSHTLSLLDKLKKTDLSASDRLEADALSRTIEGFGEELTADEMRMLNDCLATILKLTAKYKL